MSELHDWQKRVLSERNELAGKLDRLEEFLASLDAECRGFSYLELQKCAMHSYLYALDRRIELFE